MIVLVDIAADEGLYFGLSLNPDGFFDQNILTVQFLAFFIDSQPDQWSQIFVKVLAQNLFGWDILLFKFNQNRFEV